jgi:alpha-beta hydrolase superfamily lysophospholipase
MAFQQRELSARDNHRIRVFDWRTTSDSPPAAVIQILHGLGDHAMRYARFAKECNAKNLSVVAHNHRGHGAAEGFGHFADVNGWDKVIADVLQVRQDIGTQYPELPVILLGHSMGSFVAQSFVMRHRGNNAGLILSGSTLAPRPELRISHATAKLAAVVTGKRRINALLNYMGLGKMNRKFEPARTSFDWISRDEDEVDRYVADPLCGGVFSNQLWTDLTGGMLEITSKSAIRSVRADLPIFILGGECDPVGGQSGLQRLADAYRKTGHDNLTLKIYPGGRHEMLNETNRDEVTADILNWITATL